MTDLTKKETAYFIASAIASLAILVGIVSFWALEQPKCWELYASEQDAIENCER